MQLSFYIKDSKIFPQGFVFLDEMHKLESPFYKELFLNIPELEQYEILYFHELPKHGFCLPVPLPYLLEKILNECGEEVNILTVKIPEHRGNYNYDAYRKVGFHEAIKIDVDEERLSFYRKFYKEKNFPCWGKSISINSLFHEAAKSVEIPSKRFTTTASFELK
jgi:hypothetical protein